MTSEERSRVMRAVKSRDTAPEMAVRKLAHRLGFRFRLHRPDLPGKPDLVFPSRKAVVFVNGCFWHGHDCKRGARVPKVNTAYWVKKVAGNVERDASNIDALKSAGWRVLTLWECEVKAISLGGRLQRFLEKRNAASGG